MAVPQLPAPRTEAFESFMREDKMRGLGSVGIGIFRFPREAVLRPFTQPLEIAAPRTRFRICLEQNFW